LNFALLIPLIIIDIRTRLLPDKLTLSLLAINLLTAFFIGRQELIDALLGALLGGGFFLAAGMLSKVLFHREGMGGGDIKLIAALGANLGPFFVFPSIFVASLSALLFVLVRYPFTKRFFGESFPFGPFIAVGYAVTLLIKY
jgi:leader peptidase (prepilin peptidase)/N-methyltransferase